MILIFLKKRLRVPGRVSAELAMAPGPVFTIVGRVSGHTHTHTHTHFETPNTPGLTGIRERVAGFLY